MYKKILVPLDGSEFSECALGHAIDIANGCQVPEVVLLMVIEPVLERIKGEPVDFSGLEKAAETNANDYIAKVADELNKEGIGNVSSIVQKGRADEIILDYAKENDVDLIIMSTHGSSGIVRWTLGSVADRVIRHSVSPVLVASPKGCRVSV